MEADAEPMEADPVPAEADPVAEEAVSVAAEETAVTSDREGQRLVSTQTVQHEYLTLNGKVARETISVDGTVTTVMDFIYDESGRPFALKYSDDGGKSFDTYYYVLNLQGDVVKLVWYIPGFEYEAVATYTYDAWGNILSATGELAEINPLRYRGYYYDTETGFYYLQSRYYDPVNRRFISADGYASTGQGFIGYNMFAYCGNNPIRFSDFSGATFVDSLADLVDDLLEEVIGTIKALPTYASLNEMGFYRVTLSSAKECYQALMAYEIDTPEEKAHFFAQCAVETNYGMWLTELGDEEYFSKTDYGYKYRGAGYIQMTWDFNYEAFAIEMGDPGIYEYGAGYVAENYAWTSAGWIWSIMDMNSRIANGASVKDVTRTIRGSSGSWELRQECYDSFIEFFR